MKYLGLICVITVVGCASGGVKYRQTDLPTAGIFLEMTEDSSGLKSADSSELESSDELYEIERSISPDGLKLLKQFEGEIRCEANAEIHCAYNDVAGYCTIGHGHLIARSKCEDIEDRLERNGFIDGISEARAEELLVADSAAAQRYVEVQMIDRKIGDAEITDEQYDSLVSFTYNVGGKNFSRSTLLKRLKSRSDSAGNELVAHQFTRWVRAGGVIYPGLVNRRAKEVEHFFSKFGGPPEEDNEEAYSDSDFDDTLDIWTGEAR